MKIGDIFKEQNDIAISVNEFFDVELGVPVSERSIHGMFIKNIYKSDSRRLARDIDINLSQDKIGIFDRKIGRNTKYPIGTVSVIHNGDKRYYLVAMAHTDLLTSKARSDLSTLSVALDALWRKIREESGGNPVAVPLMGAGQSGTGVEPKYLLDFILLSIIKANREAPITHEISIIVPERFLGHINLNQTAVHWT